MRSNLKKIGSGSIIQLQYVGKDIHVFCCHLLGLNKKIEIQLEWFKFCQIILPMIHWNFYRLTSYSFSHDVMAVNGVKSRVKSMSLPVSLWVMLSRKLNEEQIRSQRIMLHQIGWAASYISFLKAHTSKTTKFSMFLWKFFKHLSIQMSLKKKHFLSGSKCFKTLENITVVFLRI